MLVRLRSEKGTSDGVWLHALDDVLGNCCRSSDVHREIAKATFTVDGMVYFLVSQLQD